MNLKNILQVFIFLSIIQNSYAQQKDCIAQISGVLHNTNHEPLFGATIYIEELKRGTATDENGRYKFENICLGKYTLHCQSLGFKEKVFQIEIIRQQTEKDFELEDDAVHLEEIAISNQKISNENLTQSIQSISDEALDRNKGKNLGDALKDITGVNTLQTGPSIAKPVIHGLHSNRILILNNGIRQEGQQWGSEHAPEIDPFVANKLTVIKGANAIRYGADAIGGVILVEAPDLKKEKYFGGEINSIGISNGLGGVFSSTLDFGWGKGWGGRVQGTFKRLGDSEASEYVLSNTGLREVNFSAAFGLQKKRFGTEIFFSRFDTELAILSAAHIGNLEDLERAINSPKPLEAYLKDFTYQISNPRQKITHNLLKIKAHYYLKNQQKLTLQYGGQFNNRREFDFRLGDDSKPQLFLKLSTHTLDGIYEFQQKKNWEGNVGFNLSLQDNYNVPETNIRPLIPQYQSYGTGFYWIEKYQSTKFLLDFGIRYDFRFLDVLRYDRQRNLLNPQHQFHNFSGSVGFAYFFNPHVQIKSNFASAWRPPNAAELYSEGLHHGTATIEEGKDNLQSEKAFKWINTFNYSTIHENENTGLSIEASAYYNLIQNYIFLEPKDVRLTIRGAFPVFQYNQTNASFIGFDVALKWFFVENIAYNAKISLLKAKDISRNAPLIWIPANRLEQAITYQIKQFKKIEKIYIALTFQYVAEQNYAPEVFTIAQVLASQTDESIKIPENTYDFKAAPAGYALWNVDFGAALPLKNNKLAFNLTLSNLFNVAFRDYLNRFRYFADDTGRNLTLRLKYEF